MSSRNHRRISRREALGALGGLGVTLLNSSALFAIINGLVKREAQAQMGAGSVGNLIYLLHHGAPARWCFDGFLNPSGNPDHFIANGSVKNALQVGQYRAGTPSNAIYRQTTNPFEYDLGTEKKNIYLPALWDCTLPTVESASIPMKSLLNHMCIVRGVAMPGDIGHDKGPLLLVRPHPTRLSLSGLVADASTRRVPAVGFGRFNGFSARNASLFKGRIKTNENPLDHLLGPLKLNTPVLNSAEDLNLKNWNSSLIRSKFDAALGALEQNAKLHHPGAEKFYGNLRLSRNLIDEAASLFGDLKAEFEGRCERYKQVARNCASQIGATLGSADTPDAYLLPQFNLQAGAGQIALYAPILAVTEFLIQKELSSSLTFSVTTGFNPPNFSGMDSEPIYAYDEHSQSNRQLSAIALNLNFRVLMSSLNLFKSQIGSHFDKTLVVIGAEYSRKPSFDSAGSDHAASANTVSLFSGMFQNFIPIGDIYKESGVPGGKYAGTWGQGAPTLLRTTLNGQNRELAVRITNSEISKTIADLVGVSSPVSGHSLLEKIGGKWVSKAVGEPKNV